MIEHNYNMFKINNFSIVPKFVILLLDLGATVTALFIAILIQQNVSLAATNWEHMLNSTLLILLVKLPLSVKTRQALLSIELPDHTMAKRFALWKKILQTLPPSIGQ